MKENLLDVIKCLENSLHECRNPRTTIQTGDRRLHKDAGYYIGIENGVRAILMPSKGQTPTKILYTTAEDVVKAQREILDGWGFGEE